MYRFLLLAFICFGSLQAMPHALDLETAWRRTKDLAPALYVAEAAISAREAETEQVSLLPNPILVVDAENLGVKNNHDDEADPPETTIAITQLIELGGKRPARKAFASTLEEIAWWEAEIKKCELKLALTKAFIDTAFAQEKLALAQKSADAASEAWRAWKAKVDCQKASPLLEKKAYIELKRAQAFTEECASCFELAKIRLAAFWGACFPDFESVVFSFEQLIKLPDCCTLLQAVMNAPDCMKARLDICATSKNIMLQKANRIPDVALTVGYSFYNFSSQSGWVIGVEMPLPFFDRNQGNIRRAFVEKTQAEWCFEELMCSIQERLAATYEKNAAAGIASQILKEEALAEAEDLYRAVNEGYQNGKLEYLELLEAEKISFDIQQKYLENLYEYHISLAEIARLTGENL